MVEYDPLSDGYEEHWRASSLRAHERDVLRRERETARQIDQDRQVKSRGHLGFVGRWEYVRLPDGDVGRADVSCPLGPDGYRQGLRFESTAASWQHFGERILRGEL